MPMNADVLLPQGFEALEPFVTEWSLARESARMRKRWSSTIEEIDAFYGVMIAHAERALAYLDSVGPDSYSPADERLLNLTLSLVEVGHAAEVYRQPSVPHGLPPERLAPTELA